MRRNKGVIDPVQFTLNLVRTMESNEPLKLEDLINGILHGYSAPARPGDITPAGSDIQDQARELLGKYLEIHPEILTVKENSDNSKEAALIDSTENDTSQSAETTDLPGEPVREQQFHEEKMQVSVELGPQVFDSNEYVFIRIKLPPVIEEKDISINIFPYYASVRLKPLRYEQVIALPSDSDCDNAAAVIGEGVLEIKIPKYARQELRQIRIHH